MRSNILFRASLFGALAVALTASAGAAAVIEGSVKDTNGHAAAGAQIRVNRTDRQAPSLNATTDSRGRYALKDVDVGTYSVTAIAPGGAQSTITNIKARTASAVRLEFDMRQSLDKKKVKQWVYLPSPTGTHMGGRWVEVTDANINDVAMQRVEKKTGEYLRELQSRERPSR